ncbi:hypothetical protein [Commensalibacter nepenthis]|uniref:Uncharacterized protein n=1 Tax=Commensalibacter nepenthis TaxID=3043872 RepID=A0ABT6QAG4_9PROT|nr:hypothetical protein [Commensalibacter sp. TBRC 10068]MDI2113900.1 hypothetical protein [Commensalibacter sp. TBRC 10068]
MPWIKFDTNQRIRGVIALNNVQKHQCHELIRLLGYGDLNNVARTLFRDNDNVRIDMQGITTNQEFNIQIQIGNDSVAAVLVSQNINIANIGEQNGLAHAIRSALTASVETATIWRITPPL